jgi:hypothetical protein
MLGWVAIFAWSFLKDLQNVTTRGVVKKFQWDNVFVVPTARKIDVINQVTEKTAISTHLQHIGKSSIFSHSDCSRPVTDSFLAFVKLVVDYLVRTPLACYNAYNSIRRNSSQSRS